MANADDLRGLGDEMVSAYKTRIADINSGIADVNRIKKDTAVLLTSLIKENKAREREVSGLLKGSRELLKGFRKEHNTMATELRDTLSKGRSDLSAGEAERVKTTKAEIEARIADVNRMFEDVKGMLDRFDKEHAAMATELKNILSKGRSDLSAAEAERVKTTKAEIEARAADISNMLGGFRNMLGGFRKAQEETARAWKDLLSAMEKARAGKEVKKAKPAKPKAEKAKPPKAEKAKPPVEEIPAVEETMEDKVLGVVKDMPGLTLKEIGDALDVHFVRIAGIAKALVEDGKIRKEDKEYYPAE